MKNHDANLFEEALEEAARGQATSGTMASLVKMAQTASALSAEPPPPPHGLAPGRQRFLAEASAIRAGSARPRPSWLGSPVWKLAAAALAVILVVGAVAGTGRVVANSLPGHPLYGLKLSAEGARVTITRSPEALASLNLALAEVRIVEVTALVSRGEDVEAPTVTRTTRQLEAALDAANQVEESRAPQYREELAASLRQQQMALAGAAGSEPGPAVQLLLREMERVRQEAHAGAGEPEGEQNRLRLGTPPPEPSGMPAPTGGSTPRHTGQPGEQRPTGPSAEPSASPTRTPATPPAGAPTHTPTRRPADGPAGTATQQSSATPTGRPSATATGQPGGTPGDPQPKPTQTPGPGPSQTPEPGPSTPPGPGPSQPPDPAPTQPPGPGPGPSEPPGDGKGDKGQGP